MITHREGVLKRRLVLVAVLVLATTPGMVSAAAAADPVEIPLTIEKNRFEPDLIKVKAGVPFVLAG